VPSSALKLILMDAFGLGSLNQNFLVIYAAKGNELLLCWLLNVRWWETTPIIIINEKMNIMQVFTFT